VVWLARAYMLWINGATAWGYEMVWIKNEDPPLQNLQMRVPLVLGGHAEKKAPGGNPEASRQHESDSDRRF
jgi:hypothetical protein